MNGLLWGAKLGQNTADIANVLLKNNEAREEPGWGAAPHPVLDLDRTRKSSVGKCQMSSIQKNRYHPMTVDGRRGSIWTR
jgi:hypothetical protein